MKSWTNPTASWLSLATEGTELNMISAGVLVLWFWVYNSHVFLRLIWAEFLFYNKLVVLCAAIWITICWCIIPSWQLSGTALRFIAFQLNIYFLSILFPFQIVWFRAFVNHDLKHLSPYVVDEHIDEHHIFDPKHQQCWSTARVRMLSCACDWLGRVPRQVESKITQWVRFQYTEELDDMQVDHAARSQRSVAHCNVSAKYLLGG